MTATTTSTSSKPVAVDGVTAWAATVPTDQPEADGTFAWDSTTIVVAEVSAGEATGIGYTYAAASAAGVVERLLTPAIIGRDVHDIPGAWMAMRQAVRNVGAPGIASAAISAVDLALWDLKGRVLDVPVTTLLGRARRTVPAYGSGGFTTYGPDRLHEQLAGWVDAGFRMVKIKVGRDVIADRDRVAAARDAIGPDVELFVDANGALSTAAAAEEAARYGEHGVRWFEEPVSSDDLEGLRLLRHRVPPGMAVAAGEYGDGPWYFRRMLEAGTVDVLQADATRCGGITGFLRAAALCEAWGTPLSAHTAPTAHAAVACACPNVVHVEWFHDHVRIEPMLFDGAAEAVGGAVRPGDERAGLGIEIRRADAEPFLVDAA